MITRVSADDGRRRFFKPAFTLRTGASSVTFAQPVRATHRVSLTRPTDHFQGTPWGQPICGSDRASETPHAPYQRQEHVARIITADRSRLAALIKRYSVRAFGAHMSSADGSYGAAELSGSVPRVRPRRTRERGTSLGKVCQEVA
jgi:hypothetical protein